MSERLRPLFQTEKEIIASKNTEKEETTSKQAKSREVLYDPQKQDILILSQTKSGEKKESRHPFQDFLYALRKAEIKASTSEWIDLQKALAAGEIQSLDDLYIVSRALLVKDVTGYPKFDKVFGEMFYGIEPSGPETKEEYEEEEEEGEEEEEEEEEEPGEQAKEEIEQEEKEEVQEENLSQEIVEPGYTEEHHGGEDTHKNIEESRSPSRKGVAKTQSKSAKEDGAQEKKQEEKGQKLEQGDNGGKEKEAGDGSGGKGEKGLGGGKQKEKQGILTEGKGGYSARQLIVERRYEQYDKDQILNYEQFIRVLSKLTAIIEEVTEVPTRKLDTAATVKSIAEHAGIPELRWREETEKKPKVILMFDVGGSTDEFRPIMEKLFAAAKDYLDDVEVYYFHNAIYGEVWPQKDGNYGKHFIPLKDILKKDPDSRIIIVGDAWMAEDELYGDYTNESGHYFPSGIDSFKQLQKNFDHVVWINPIKEVEHDKWDESGTIAEIKKIFPMYDMTLRGLEGAVQKLIQE